MVPPFRTSCPPSQSLTVPDICRHTFSPLPALGLSFDRPVFRFIRRSELKNYHMPPAIAIAMLSRPSDIRVADPFYRSSCSCRIWRCRKERARRKTNDSLYGKIRVQRSKFRKRRILSLMRMPATPHHAPEPGLRVSAYGPAKITGPVAGSHPKSAGQVRFTVKRSSITSGSV